MNQKILQQLYDQAQMEYGPEAQENLNLINPERGYFSDSLNRFVEPFSDAGSEMAAKSELDKHSSTVFGKEFDKVDESNKLKLLLEMQKLKKEIGLPVQDTSL